jgi:hypothetical protein
MIFYWVKNNKIGSKLIRWGTSGKASHFAVEFDKKVILESTMLSGVRLNTSFEFKKHNDIVYSLEITCSLEQEEEIYQAMIKGIVDKYRYDYAAILYFTYRVFLKKIFNKPIPEENKYDDVHAYMCIEIAKEFPDFVFGNAKKPKSLAMFSPDNLYWLLFIGRQSLT